MLGIIIVTYKSYDRIKEYVKNDLLSCTLPLKIVVVDVGSERSSAERIAASLNVHVSEFDEKPADDVVVLSMQENLGYARGNNYGTRYILRHFPEAEQLLFSNDDVRFIQGPVIEQLVDVLHRHPDVGVIGPDIVDLKGNHQGPAYHDPTIAYMIASNLCEPLFGAGSAMRFFHYPEHKRESGYANILAGCFLMVDTKAFVNANMFDERTFLYWEEYILSKRMAAIGKKVFYEDSVQIQHLIGASMKQTKGPNLLLLKNMLAGGNLYFACYKKSGWFAYSLLRLSNGIRLFLVYLALLKYKIKCYLGLIK